MNRSSDNYGFGPVHKERRKKPIKILCLFFLFIIVVLQHDLESLKIYTALVLVGVFGEFLRRICLFAEEYRHAETRYKGSKYEAFKACLGFGDLYNYKQTTLLLITIALLVTVYNRPLYLSHFIIWAAFTSLPLYILDLGMRSKLEIGHDQRMKYVADGQAWGFYVGYLKIIFEFWQSTIAKARGEKFQNSEGEDYRKLLADKRLFILIPIDGDCYNKIEELDPKIKFVTKMPELKYFRGGVQERTYQNCLYKIERDGKEDDVYVMLEYATPLLNMFDMSQNSERFSSFKFTQADREEQVNEFYNTLNTLLAEDSLCKGKYDLVLMGPAEELKSGKLKLSDIICDRINNTAMEF